MPDLWFSPTRLRFQSVHVRGPTEWVFFELCDDAGTTGSAEITATQLNESVLPVVSRLASSLRGERLEADVDVLKLCSVGPDDCEADRTLATAVSGLRCAVSDALAQRAQMSLTDYLRWSHQHKGVMNRTVELYANINRSLLPNDRGQSTDRRTRSEEWH